MSSVRQSRVAPGADADAAATGYGAAAPRGALLPRAARDRDVTTLRARDENPNEENSAAALTLWCGRGARAAALAAVLATVLKPVLFSRLRTREQLGYIVQLARVGLPGAGRPAALELLVQSRVAPPRALTARLLRFLADDAAAAVRALDAAALASVAAALADERRAPDNTLAEQAGRHWAELQRARDDALLLGERVDDDEDAPPLRPRWARRKDVARALRALTPEDVRAFYDQTLAPGAPQRRALAVEIYGSAARDAFDAPSADPTTPIVGDVLEARALLEPLPAPSGEDLVES